MAKYGSSSFVVSVGGTNMSNYIDMCNGLDIEANLQESHAYGDSWIEQLYSGVRKHSPVTMSGFYDDTASTGPDVIFNTLGTTVAVILTYGGTKTSSFSAIVQKYKRTPARGESTRFEVTLVPSGAVTEA